MDPRRPNRLLIGPPFVPSLTQRLLEIRQQIPPVFDSNRHPHQPVSHSCCGELRLREARVRRGLRMANQGLYTTQRNGVISEAESAQKIKRLGLAAAKLERKHCPWKIALCLENANLAGILEQRGVVDLLY